MISTQPGTCARDRHAARAAQRAPSASCGARSRTRGLLQISCCRVTGHEKPGNKAKTTVSGSRRKQPAPSWRSPADRPSSMSRARCRFPNIDTWHGARAGGGGSSTEEWRCRRRTGGGQQARCARPPLCDEEGRSGTDSVQCAPELVRQGTTLRLVTRSSAPLAPSPAPPKERRSSRDGGELQQDALLRAPILDVARESTVPREDADHRRSEHDQCKQDWMRSPTSLKEEARHPRLDPRPMPAQRSCSARNCSSIVRPPEVSREHRTDAGAAHPSGRGRGLVRRR